MPFPVVGDGGGARRAQVVDHEGPGRGVRTRLRLLTRAPLPVGDQHPLAVRGCRPGQAAVGDGVREVADAVGVEPGLLAGGVGGVDPSGLDREQALGANAGRRLVDGRGHGPAVGGPGGQRSAPVGEFLGGGLVVGGDSGHGHGPARAQGEVDGQAASYGPAQGGLDAVAPGSAAPAVVGGVQQRLVPDAVVDGGDLGSAETGVRDLVDLAGHLVGVDQAVRPPPPELRAHRPGGVGEPPGRAGGPVGGRAGGEGGDAGRGGDGGGGHPRGHGGGQHRAPGHPATLRDEFVHECAPGFGGGFR